MSVVHDLLYYFQCLQAARKVRERFFPEWASSDAQKIPPINEENLKTLTDVFSTTV
jgi:hypothetical protein